MTDKVAKTREAKHRRVQKILDECRKSIHMVQNYCVGCTVMKSEGCRSYSDPAPIINNKCTICHKPIFKKDNSTKTD